MQSVQTMQEYGQINIKLAKNEKKQFKRWCDKVPRMKMSEFLRFSWEFFRKNPQLLIGDIDVKTFEERINELEVKIYELNRKVKEQEIGSVDAT